MEGSGELLDRRSCTTILQGLRILRTLEASSFFVSFDTFCNSLVNSICAPISSETGYSKYQTEKGVVGIASL